MLPPTGPRSLVFEMDMKATISKLHRHLNSLTIRLQKTEISTKTSISNSSKLSYRDLLRLHPSLNIITLAIDYLRWGPHI